MRNSHLGFTKCGALLFLNVSAVLWLLTSTRCLAERESRKSKMRQKPESRLNRVHRGLRKGQLSVCVSVW